MIDLKLDSDHDLAIENYDNPLVTEVDRVRQHIDIRLQFFFGEWYLDNTLGVKYFELIFVKNPNLSLVGSLIRATILDTPNVREILEYNQTFSVANRELEVSFKVNTSYGEVTDTLSLGVQ